MEETALAYTAGENANYRSLFAKQFINIKYSHILPQ